MSQQEAQLKASLEVNVSPAMLERATRRDLYDAYCSTAHLSDLSASGTELGSTLLSIFERRDCIYN